MKRASTLFLRLALIVITLGVLALCIFALPGGLVDPFFRWIVIGMYGAAIPFFIALYQSMKLLQYIDKSTAFSDLSVRALVRIKYCAFAIALIFTALLPHFYAFAQLDDAPGVLALGLLIVGVSLMIAVFAAVLKGLLQNAIAMKSENELTV
jgi:hypothetical protein